MKIFQQVHQRDVLINHSNTNVADYFKVLWSLLSDTFLACKVMHSGQIANGFESNFEIAAKIIGATKGISMMPVPFVGIVGSMFGFVAEREKKQAVTRVACLVSEIGNIDTIAETVARQLTEQNKDRLMGMPSGRQVSRVERFKTKWYSFRGDEFTSEAKRLAKGHADEIVKKIVEDSEGKLKSDDLETLKLNLIKCVDPNYAAAGPATTITKSKGKGRA